MDHALWLGCCCSPTTRPGSGSTPTQRLPASPVGTHTPPYFSHVAITSALSLLALTIPSASDWTSSCAGTRSTIKSLAVIADRANPAPARFPTGSDGSPGWEPTAGCMEGCEAALRSPSHDSLIWCAMDWRITRVCSSVRVSGIGCIGGSYECGMGKGVG
jgi:hypothetical protein